MSDTSSTEPQPDVAREPTLDEYLTQLLDTIGAPAEKEGVSLTLQQRHANMMGRYAEIISQHRVALIQAEASQRSLLTNVRKAVRQMKRGEIAKATARLAQIVTIDTATKALKR
jgi:hypothetical protein